MPSSPQPRAPNALMTGSGLSTLDPEQSHIVLVYTAVPGSESHKKLQLLSVIGPQHVVPQTLPNA